LSIFVSFVLTWTVSPGEEIGAGYGVGRVKETSMMAEADLERRVLKLFKYIL
jgi:hypothetical protein